MTTPQVLVLILLCIRIVCGAVAHGQPRTGTINGLMEWLWVGIWFALLWWGGFWK